MFTGNVSKHTHPHRKVSATCLGLGHCCCPALGAVLLGSPRHRGGHRQRGSGRKNSPEGPNMGMVQPQAINLHPQQLISTLSNKTSVTEHLSNIHKTRELLASQSCCPKESAAISELKQQQGLQNASELGCCHQTGVSHYPEVTPDPPTWPWLSLGRDGPLCTPGSLLDPQRGRGWAQRPCPGQSCAQAGQSHSQAGQSHSQGSLTQRPQEGQGRALHSPCHELTAGSGHPQDTALKF